MLKIAIITNTLFTMIAVGIAIFVLQLNGMMIRDGNFVRFRDRVSDEDRDAILRSASEAVSIGVVPLLLTNIAWIAILYSAEYPKAPVKCQTDT